MSDFFRIYDTLLEGIRETEKINCAIAGANWAAVGTEERFGIALLTEGASRPPLLKGEREGMSLAKLAGAVCSWNLEEASYGLAAINAFYNTQERLEQLQCEEPFDNFCTGGLALRGKRLGVVGHLRMPAYIEEEAGEVLYLERKPGPGDFPDSACDWILPTCDIVLITGSALINKTLPHLLELCRDAYTILVGPSVPMCERLLDCGIDRLSGLVITEQDTLLQAIRCEKDRTPYPMGKAFLLSK